MGQTAKLSVQLLGGLSLSIAGKPLAAIPSRAIEAVLVFAACHDAPVSRDHLINLIWEDSEPKQASANLRATLSALRKIAGDYVEITRQHVAVKHALVEVDALVFEKRMASMESLSAEGLESTLALYQGDFLAQFRLRSGRDFEDWMLILRERLRRLAVEGLRQIVQIKLDSAEFSRGIRHAASWLHNDPYSESAHRQMMWLLLRDGQRNAALRQYEKCRQTLEEEIGVEPSKTTSSLFYFIRDLPFPPDNKLPSDRTPLIGRETEIVHLSNLIASKRGQLITLLGPGGVGKTRLAIAVGRQVAKEKMGQFLQGVYFVSLAAISTLGELVQAIAAELSITLRGETATKQLIESLAERETLLILDNFEQLLPVDAAINLITDLLQQAPKVKLVITSRERLDLYQETIFDVAGLGLPDETPVEAAASNPENYDAVKLFIQRAQQVRRDYQPESYAPVLETCRLVSGSPLAIELAASWVRYLSPSEIANNVAQSLDFLATRNRDLPARHRSLQAVFDHSWKLLDQDERQVLTKLAVFPAQFGVAAANAVADTSLSMLTTLVDKSLLLSDTSRYALHATVRSFALKQIDAKSREKAEIELVEHYANWIDTQLDEATNTVDQRVISAEISNIRSAWQFAIQHKLSGALDCMMPPFFAFLIQRAWFSEGIDRFTQALDVVSEQAPFLVRRARFHIFVSDFVAAECDLDTALEMGVESAESVVISGYRAIIRTQQGQFQAAYELSSTAVSDAHAASNAPLHAFALNLLGGTCKMLGRFEEARRHYSQGREIRRQLGDVTGEAMVLNNLGTLAQAQQQFDEASNYYEQCSQLFKSLNQPVRAAVTLSNAGNLAWQAGNYTKAQVYLDEALVIRNKHGNRLGVAITSINLCHVLLSLNQLADASVMALSILPVVESHNATPYILELYVIAANIAAQSGNMTLQQDLLQYILNHDALTLEIRNLAEAQTPVVKLNTAATLSSDVKALSKQVNQLLKSVV